MLPEIKSLATVALLICVIKADHGVKNRYTYPGTYRRLAEQFSEFVNYMSLKLKRKTHVLLLLPLMQLRMKTNTVRLTL